MRSRPVLAAVLLVVLAAGCRAAGSPADSSSERSVAHRAGASPRASATASPTPRPPYRLTLTTYPPGAQVILTGLDGLRRGVTPYAATLPGGSYQLRLTRVGRAPSTRTVDLSTDRAIVAWLDPPGQLLSSRARWSTGPAPKQVAFTSDSRQIWTTLLGGHGVQVFDAASGRLLRTIRLGAKGGAVEVVFTRDGGTAYVSQMETASVFQIDTASFQVRRQLPTKGSWTKVLALSPDERTLYAANWISNDVSEIDLATGAVRRLLPAVRTPRGLYATPDGRSLYVAGFEHGEIQHVDLRTGRGRVIMRTGGAMRHLVGDPRTGRLYADDMALGRVYVVDTRTDRVRALAAVDRMPNTMDLDPSGRVLYVSCRGRNNPKTFYIPGPEWGSVVLVDTASGRLLDAVVGGNQPTGLDVSPDGATLAFSDFLDNRIRTYAIPSYATLAGGRGGRVVAHRADLAK